MLFCVTELFQGRQDVQLLQVILLKTANCLKTQL